MNAPPSAATYASVASRPPNAAPPPAAKRSSFVTLGPTGRQPPMAATGRMAMPAIRIGTGPGAPRIRAPRRGPAAVRGKHTTVHHHRLATPGVASSATVAAALATRAVPPAVHANDTGALLTRALNTPRDDQASLASPPDVLRSWRGHSLAATPSSGSLHSMVASGTDSSFAVVSGAQSPAVELDSSGSWSVVGEDSGDGVEAMTSGRRVAPLALRHPHCDFAARGRLPADRLLGDPSVPFAVGELERRLDALALEHGLDAEIYNELFKQMACAPSSSDVGLALHCIERCVDTTRSTDGLPELAGRFLQLNDRHAASLVYDTLRRAHGNLRNATLADVAAYMVQKSDNDGHAANNNLHQLSIRREALEAHWRRQPKGAWTLALPA